MNGAPRRPTTAGSLARLAFAFIAATTTGQELSAAPRLPPEAGSAGHTAELCVETLPLAARCGPAQLDLHQDGGLRLRIDDIVYSLQLHHGLVEVVVMHNTVQIDEFTAPCEWVGNALRFVDDARNSRYEIRLAQSRPPGR